MIKDFVFLEKYLRVFLFFIENLFYSNKKSLFFFHIFIKQNNYIKLKRNDISLFLKNLILKKNFIIVLNYLKNNINILFNYNY